MAPDDISVFPLFDLGLERIQCARFVWRSRFWQLHNVKHDIGTCPAIRPFVAETWSFMAVACRQAWWNMSHHQITSFAFLYQADFKACSSCFQLLWDVIQRELKITDGEVLVIVQQRVVKGFQKEAAETLLQCDEAHMFVILIT